MFGKRGFQRLREERENRPGWKGGGISNNNKREIYSEIEQNIEQE